MTVKCPIEHAKSYPFEIPEGSFVLDKHGWRPLPVGGHKTENRHPVIASGSNASPQRLSAKYQDHGHLLDDPLYVTCATLHDFDAVYSAHISCYGSIPATLAHAPGAEAEVFVTWLNDAQLERMHETESVGVNYDFVRLDGIGLVVEDGSGYTRAHTYLSRHGCLNHGGQPVSLSALNTKGRIWNAMNQTEVLNYARGLVAPQENADGFIAAQIESKDTRRSRTAQLAEKALDHGWAGSLKIIR